MSQKSTDTETTSTTKPKTTVVIRVVFEGSVEEANALMDSLPPFLRTFTETGGRIVQLEQTFSNKLVYP